MDFLATKEEPEDFFMELADMQDSRDSIFDMDLQKTTSDFLSDEWSAGPDDLLDSFFSLDNSFLNDLDDSDNINLNDIATIHERISPVPSAEPEFLGFLDTTNEERNNNVSEYVNYVSNGQSKLSSSSSDSGLSSDNMEIDVSPDYEPLSPTLSSPGPSISERGGQNSPPRCISNIQQLKTPPKPVSQYVNTVPSKVNVEKIQTVKNCITIKKEHGQIQQTPKIKTNIISKKEVKIYKMAPAIQQYTTTDSPNKKVTIRMQDTQGVVKNQPGTFILNKSNGNISGVRKLIRVQNPVNPRSILLPVSIQNVKDFRTIKIINASNLNNKSPSIKLAAANLMQQSKQGLVKKNVLVSQDQLIDDSLSDHTSDAESYVFEDVMLQSNSIIAAVDAGHNSDSSDSTQETQASYQQLMLTSEEKRLLAKEGIVLPGNYPLTKHEERELKRIRRKIRNKISAQDSRKRKKEYVDGLEERVKQCTDDNQTLMKRIKLLQSQNHNLMGQMKKLQSLLTKGTNKTAQPATCLMVLLLSLALVAVPNLKLGQSAKETALENALQESLTQNRRNLLFDTKEQFGDALVDEEMNLDDILAFNDINEQDYADVDAGSSVPVGKKPREFIELDVDDKIWKPPLLTNNEFQNKANDYQYYLKRTHSSGFNISKINSIELDNHNNGGGLDKNVMDMISQKSNGIFELSLDKLSTFTKDVGEFDIGHDKFIFDNTLDKSNKLNASQISAGERNILLKGA